MFNLCFLNGVDDGKWIEKNQSFIRIIVFGDTWTVVCSRDRLHSNTEISKILNEVPTKPTNWTFWGIVEIYSKCNND